LVTNKQASKQDEEEELSSHQFDCHFVGVPNGDGGTENKLSRAK